MSNGSKTMYKDIIAISDGRQDLFAWMTTHHPILPCTNRQAAYLAYKTTRDLKLNRLTEITTVIECDGMILFDDGCGGLVGDGVGTINYTVGRLTFRFDRIPANGTEVIAHYNKW